MSQPIYAVTWYAPESGSEPAYIVDFDAEDEAAVDLACSMAVALAEAGRRNIVVHAHGAPIPSGNLDAATERVRRVMEMKHMGSAT